MRAAGRRDPGRQGRVTWVQLDDRWDLNSKLERASEVSGVGDSAWSLWARAVTHCNRELTDGRVHGATLRARTKNRKPQVVIDALVKVGALLVVGEDEYEIHDYLDWNPDRKSVEVRREKKREAASRGGIASGLARQKPANVEQKANENEAPCFASGSTETNHPGVKSSPSPLRSDPDLISENSVLLSPPAGPTGPQPQEVDGPKEIRKQPPGLGQQVLAELKLHPSLEPIATRDFAKAVGAHLMTAGKPMPWVLEAIRDVAVVVAGQGLSAEALAKKTFSFIKNARRPRDPEATANDTRPVDAPTAREALPTWVTNPKVEREATEDELRATALEAHAQGMPVPPALRQYLPSEVA